MPTLSELVQEVNTILDYNPDMESYKRQVRRAINRHYMEISSRYPWNFLQKVTELTLRAPIRGEDTGDTIEEDAVNTRRVDGVGTAFAEYLEGHYLHVGTSKRRIIRVESATELYIDSAFDGGEIASATSAWVIRFEGYDLPRDVVDILGIMSRNDDRGRIVLIDFRKEEEHFMDTDISGDPIVAVEKPAEFTEAPSRRPESSLQAGGALTAGTTYEYMYTIKELGRESAPSTVIEGTPSGGNLTVRLTGLESLNYATGLWSGRRRLIYRRVQNHGSKFFLIAEQGQGSGVIFDDDGTATPGYETETFEEDGMRQRLRMWFTPDADLTVELRYQSMPRRLQSDADQPEWPKQFHHLLVYSALQDAGMQHGMTGFSQLYERRSELLLNSMRARYLTRANRDYVRQGFDRGLYGRQERWGVPTKS